MTLGNLLALAQKNMKRLLAYSSIAHAGYILIGLVAVTELGMTSVVFYLIAYLFTNLAAFGVVAACGRIIGSDEIAAYAGLSRRNPGLALIFLIAMLSLAGMPPFAGFVVKFAVFAAAVDAGMIWLAVIGVLNSIIGLYYYLTVLEGGVPVSLGVMKKANAIDPPIGLSTGFVNGWCDCQRCDLWPAFCHLQQCAAAIF
jgi:NADH-quinone oxidoreductase subunit N